MKALAIDGAISKLTISAKNDDKTATLILDIGMKQSENIVPAIDYVLKKVEVQIADLDYLTLSIGPGSFTGLRLAISALKAIQLASNADLYGISSLAIYSYEFKEFGLPVLSGIDANKGCYYANITDYSSKNEDGKYNELLCDGDWEIQKVIEKATSFDKIIVCGPDSDKLSALIKEKNPKMIILSPCTQIVTTEALFAITEEKIQAGEEPLKDFDGPKYLRASEAEQKAGLAK
ncbi:MAG: tRNA (adenosine(37)-N6)-threonylcarbamoyltransferase complex dimerization subunit type 1 TsaB [Treponema sp.]|nr:tRNA (adenosine(37)-N6)-threonylcarbamoyltransferase complex dimerization subunit type 1 TsaB [Treponema sp.]